MQQQLSIWPMASPRLPASISTALRQPVAEGVEEDAEGSVAGSTPTGSTVYWQVDGGPVDITITWIRSEA